MQDSTHGSPTALTSRLRQSKAVHYVNEPASIEPHQSDDYATTYAQRTDCPIVLDNGVSWLRAGWADESDPRIQCESVVSRYRDRRAGKPIMLAGAAASLEHNSRISAKSPFEGDVVVAFDAMVRAAYL